MTRILGQINDSGGRPITCTIEVVLPGGTVDKLQTPPAWNLAIPAYFPCEAGRVDFELTPTWNQTYQFRIFTTTVTETWRTEAGQIFTGATHQDELTAQWYTGSEPSDARELLLYEARQSETDIVPTFYASIPASGTVNIADLQPSGITPTNIDTSILAIANLLVTRPEYLAQIRAAIEQSP